MAVERGDRISDESLRPFVRALLALALEIQEQGAVVNSAASRAGNSAQETDGG